MIPEQLNNKEVIPVISNKDDDILNRKTIPHVDILNKKTIPRYQNNN